MNIHTYFNKYLLDNILAATSVLWLRTMKSRLRRASLQLSALSLSFSSGPDLAYCNVKCYHNFFKIDAWLSNQASWRSLHLHSSFRLPPSAQCPPARHCTKNSETWAPRPLQCIKLRLSSYTAQTRLNSRRLNIAGRASLSTLESSRHWEKLELEFPTFTQNSPIMGLTPARSDDEKPRGWKVISHFPPWQRTAQCTSANPKGMRNLLLQAWKPLFSTVKLLQSHLQWMLSAPVCVWR